jgi:biopolymer transport protein ExbD
MARHKTIPTEPEPEPQLDISSLIDVCFLLLIYFLVTSTIAPRERDLPLAMPGDNPAPSSPIEPMFIRVDAAGAVFTGTGVGERPMDNDPASRDLPLLASHLELYMGALRGTREKPLVQIWVDPEVMQQRVIDVLNALAAAGMANVTFTDLVEKL